MNGITVTNSDHLPLGCGHTKCMTPQRNQIVAIVLLSLNLLATIPGLTALNLMKVPSVIWRKSETTYESTFSVNFPTIFWHFEANTGNLS